MLKAEWVPTVYDFDFISPNGGEQTFTAPADGYYKLEVWGAQGGNTYIPASYNYGYPLEGGYGGYAVGITALKTNTILYINVGQQPSNLNGGYNGGGNGSTQSGWGGGGATHIATVSGQLKDLSSYKGTLVNNDYYNSLYILIVAGGGGASEVWRTGLTGSSGGGYIGQSGRITNDTANYDKAGGGTQTTGGSAYTTDSFSGVTNGGFGYGGKSHASWGSGAGGGWYGGGGGGSHPTQWTASGGGGSGYIGSSNLISGGEITKHMTCYSCATSNAEATLTYSNTTTPSATATADVAKAGNGAARITYLGTSL